MIVGTEAPGRIPAVILEADLRPAFAASPEVKLIRVRDFPEIIGAAKKAAGQPGPDVGS